MGDAVVSTLLCMGVTQPHKCGLGGGFFAIYYNRSRRQATAFSAREMAPIASTSNMYLRRGNASLVGFLSVAVPGELYGYDQILKELGSAVPWEELFQDAIRMAEGDVVVSAALAQELLVRRQHVVSDPDLCSLFCSREHKGDVLQVGETFRNPTLGQTLREISRGSYKVLYGGEVGMRLVQDIRNGGGIMTLVDLERYETGLKSTRNRTFADNVTVHVLPPPSSAAVPAFLLAVMDQYRIAASGSAAREEYRDGVPTLHDGDGTIHRFIEASKFAFVKRMEVADPTHIDVSETMDDLMLEHYMSTVLSRIRTTPYRNERDYGLRYHGEEGYGSCQMVLLNRDGDAFAAVSSINTPLGALSLSRSTGILLNNQMGDFARPGQQSIYGLAPNPANYIRPGKRPSSSITPMVVTNSQGDVIVVLSSTGDLTIASSIAQTLMRYLWMNHTIKEAIDAPRVHHQLVPYHVKAERNLDADVRAGLLTRGHQLVNYTWQGNVIAVVRRFSENRLYAALDYRYNATGSIDGD